MCFFYTVTLLKKLSVVGHWWDFIVELLHVNDLSKVVLCQYMYYQQPRYQEKELLHSNDEDGKKSIAGSSEVVCTPAVSSSGPSG